MRYYYFFFVFRYANIKKKCCVERAIPTQVMVLRTMSNPKSALSVATKVAIQMNCKLGGTPWLVDIPLSELMTIGIDVAHDAKDRGKSYSAMVATMDLRLKDSDSSRTKKFFSTVNHHKNGEELSNQLCLNITKALHAYTDYYKKLPAKICIYRDGVGEGQTKYVYEHEVEQIKATLSKIYEKVGSQYKMCFIVVSKRINTRIFHGTANPVPGTVVDDVITLPER